MSTTIKPKAAVGKDAAEAAPRKRRLQADSAGAAAPQAPPPTPCAVLESDLTIQHAQAVHQALCRWHEQGLTDLDLTAAQGCDSAGVQLLLAARRSAAAAGRELRLRNASVGVIDALARLGLGAQLQHLATDAGA